MSGRISVFVRTAVGILLAAACLADVGCSKKEEIPELVSVTGKVTFQGQPIPNASISFVASDEDVEATEIVRPSGKTDDNGEYELSWKDLEGAPPGKYAVMIMAFKDTDDDEVKPESLIPVKYNSPKTSGLTAVVNENRENVFNFDLPG